MPLPFQFQGKGVLDFVSSDQPLPQFLPVPPQEKWNNCYMGLEPTSVLDTKRSPSPPTSSSTLSSSLGGGSSSEGGGAGPEKCNLGGMEEFENVLSDFAASPTPDQSMLGYILGDSTTATIHHTDNNTNLVDPAALVGGLNKFSMPPLPLGFQGFGPIYHQVQAGGQDMGTVRGNNMMGVNESCIAFSAANGNGFGSEENALFGQLSQGMYSSKSMQSFEEKPQIFNPQVVINQHQNQPSQNQPMFMPLSYAQQEQNIGLPPNSKRLNTGPGIGLEQNNQPPKNPFLLQNQQQLHLLPNHLQNRPTMVPHKSKLGDEEMVLHQQAIAEQLFKAVELVQMGNLVLAQAILARLNHQLSPIGKPFQRVAFFFKESLQLLLQNNNSISTTSSILSSPFNLIFKIGAYKSFSEISPLVQFANFTCNQAILEALKGYDRIHIIDFDIGYGGQWASLMQEMALRNGGAPSLKITAFASPSTHDELELGLTRENLTHFASEINIRFELDILSFDSLNSMPLHVLNEDAIAVNLPISAFSSYPSSLPLALRFVSQLSPKILVCLDTGCDRNDLPFPDHVIHALQSYTSLLESLDAVNVNMDTLQKIERFLFHPAIEKLVIGRHGSPEKAPHWRSLFLSSGFSPLQFSNFTESQADCLVQRTPVRGFHVEKRQSSLVIFWQQKEIMSASAWRC